MKEKRRGFNLIVTLLLATRIQSENKKYKIKVNVGGKEIEPECSQPDKTTFFKIRVLETSNIPFSLRIASSSLTEEKKYIKDTSGNKRYGMYQLGEMCHYHTQRDSINTNPVFILIIQGNGAQTNSCKVSGVISNLGVQPCADDTTKDIFTLLQLQTEGGASLDPLNFKSLKLPKLNRYKPESLVRLDIDKFELSDLDERILEAMLIIPIFDSVNHKLVTMLNLEQIADINNNLAFNPFTSKIHSEGVMNRIVRDDLPGYYLDLYNGIGDDSSKFVQKSFKYSGQISSSFQAEFYIAKAAEIVSGEVHAVEVTSKPFREKNHNKKILFREFLYKIEIRRVKKNLEFQVTRDNVAIPSLKASLVYTGGKEFIYFSLTVGSGILYLNKPYSGRMRHFETLHVFLIGKPPIQAVNRFDEDALVSSIISYANDMTKFRWIKAEFKASEGINENKAGFRVTGLTSHEGAMPPFLISNFYDQSQYKRCYFKIFSDTVCLAMALLADPDEVRSDEYRGVWSGGREMNSIDKASGCRLLYFQRRCMSPQPGYILDVVEGLKGKTRTPFNEGLVSLEFFEGLDQKTKDFAYVFQNNVGTKYLLVKIKSKIFFKFFFNFFS